MDRVRVVFFLLCPGCPGIALISLLAQTGVIYEGGPVGKFRRRQTRRTETVIILAHEPGSWFIGAFEVERSATSLSFGAADGVKVVKR